MNQKFPSNYFETLFVLETKFQRTIDKGTLNEIICLLQTGMEHYSALDDQSQYAFLSQKLADILASASPAKEPKKTIRHSQTVVLAKKKEEDKSKDLVKNIFSNFSAKTNSGAKVMEEDISVQKEKFRSSLKFKKKKTIVPSQPRKNPKLDQLYSSIEEFEGKLKSFTEELLSTNEKELLEIMNELYRNLVEEKISVEETIKDFKEADEELYKDAIDELVIEFENKRDELIQESKEKLFALFSGLEQTKGPMVNELHDKITSIFPRLVNK